jgi:hypothetical protein
MTDPSSLTVTTTVTSDNTQPAMPKATIDPNLFAGIVNQSSNVNYHVDFLSHMNDVVDYLTDQAKKQQELLTLVDSLHVKLTNLKDALNLKVQSQTTQEVVQNVKTAASLVKKEVSFIHNAITFIMNLFAKKK